MNIFNKYMITLLTYVENIGIRITDPVMLL